MAIDRDLKFRLMGAIEADSLVFLCGAGTKGLIEARDGFGEGLPKERMDLAVARTDHVNWILTSIPVLEERVAPFLNFHAI
jgi:hypothetical protein